MAGEIEEAVDLASDVLGGKPPAEAAAYAALALAQVAHERGDIAGLRAHGARTLELAHTAGERAVEALALDLVAWADMWEGKSEAAEERWRHAGAIALELGDRTLAARADGSRALSAVFRGELETAERSADQAMRVASESGSMRARAAAHTAASRLREYQGRLDEAVELGRECLRLATQGGDPLEAIAACTFCLGGPLYRLGRLDEAWEALEQGIELSRRLGGTAYTPNLRFCRVRVLLARGDVEAAEAEVTELAGPWTDEEDGAQAAEVRARVRAAQGRTADAEEAWREALGRRHQGVTRVEIELGYAGFLLEHGRIGEAGTTLDGVRAAPVVHGVPLLEQQLGELEARLARA